MSNQFNIDRQLALRIVTGDFNAQQSAVAELRALLAAPVVERQADAWVDPYTIKAIACNPQSNDRFAMAAHKDERNGYTQPLYTSPPAPVAVVQERMEFEKWIVGEWPLAPLRYVRDALPEDDPLHGTYCDEFLQRAWVGWQARACLDKVKEMNR